MLKRLLNSAKFWAAVGGIVTGVGLAANGLVAWETVLDAVKVLIGAVIAGIAVEDSAEKLGVVLGKK